MDQARLLARLPPATSAPGELMATAASKGQSEGLDRTLTLDDVRGRATISIEQAASLLGVSRGVAYEAARRGDLPCLSLGACRLVCVPRLLARLGAGPQIEGGDTLDSASSVEPLTRENGPHATMMQPVTRPLREVDGC